MAARGAVTGMRLGLEWASAGRPLAGTGPSGDELWLRAEGARVHIAVMDGLGHGHDAHEASTAAVRSLESLPEADLERKMDAMHQALRRTRGAAVALAEADLSTGRLDWCGVGNIQGLIRGGAGWDRLVSSNGIVGLSMPSRLRVKTSQLEPGGLLLLATDGLREGMAAAVPAGLPAEALAERLLREHARAEDDALLWVGCIHG